MLWGSSVTPSDSLQPLGRSGLQGYSNYICISVLLNWEPFQAQLQPKFGKRADSLKGGFFQLTEFCVHLCKRHHRSLPRECEAG